MHKDWKVEFRNLRFDPRHHLGLGDIRLTIGQQEQVLETLDAMFLEIERLQIANQKLQELVDNRPDILL